MLASCVPVWKHVLILLCLCMALCMVSANFNCYSQKSTLSNTTDDATSEISCADVPGWENYTLTSCGVEPSYPNDDRVDGARMTVAGKCVAINGMNGQGVYAWIRCCDFSHIGRASSVALPRWQANGWNKRNTSNCSSVGAHYITGCNAWSPWQVIYWAFPGTFDPYTNTNYEPDTDYPLTQQSCTVVDGGATSDLTRPTSGSGTCLSFSSNDVELGCVTRMSTTPTVNNPVVTSVSCGGGYAMIGCSGWSQNGNVNAWYIENDVCYFKGQGGQLSVRAIAICCMLQNFAPTLSPTQDFVFLSNSPTPSPTHWPSHPPIDSEQLVAIMPISNSPTFSPTYSPINWSTHVPSSSFDDNLAPTGSSSFADRFENSLFIIILCASIALAVICCLGWAGVVFARTYIVKPGQNIKDDSSPMFEDGIEDQQQNIVPGAPQQQQQQQQPSPAMFRPYHHQIMINPMNVQRVDSNFENDEKITAEGDPDEDECDDDGEQRQFGQSISEAADSSLMMHDDHWAVLKVTNFHGVDDAHKCEIFETETKTQN